jgi:hypothetical protein
MAMDTFVELKATISQFQAKMAEARSEMDKTTAKGNEAGSKMGILAAGLAAGVGVAAVSVAKFSIDAANNAEDARAKLDQALKDSGHSFEQFAGPIGQAESHMEHFGYTNAQTMDALGVLTTALGDPNKALHDLGTAADLAAYKHVDLSTAAVGVAKAEEGNLRALKQMGIDLPVVASSSEKVKVAQDNVAKATAAANAFLATHHDALTAGTKDHAAYEKALGKVTTAQSKFQDVSTAGGQIMDALNQKIGGQGSAAADTLTGKTKELHAKMTDLGQALGEKLIPILTTLVDKVTSLVGWFQKHKDASIALGVALGILSIALAAYAASLIAAGIAELFALWPIFVIALAVAALVLGIVELKAHWNDVWSFIKQKADDAAGGVKSALDGLKTAWNDVWAALGTAVKWIWENVIKPVVDAVKQGAKDVASGVDDIKKSISQLPGGAATVTGGSPIGFLLHAVGFQHGGMVGGPLGAPRLAVVHGGEMVLTPGQQRTGGGGNTVINVTLNIGGSVVTEREITEAVRTQLVRDLRSRTGLFA